MFLYESEQPNQFDQLHFQAAKVRKTKPAAGFSSRVAIPVLRI